MIARQILRRINGQFKIRKRLQELRKLICFWNEYPKGVIYAGEYLREYFSHLPHTRVYPQKETMTLLKAAGCLEEDRLPQFDRGELSYESYLIDTSDREEFFFANLYFFYQNAFLLHSKVHRQWQEKDVQIFENLLFRPGSAGAWNAESFINRNAPIRGGKDAPERTVVGLASNGNVNIFHWLYDPGLINYRRVQELDPDTVKECLFYTGGVFAKGKPLYASDSLTMLGIGDERLIDENIRAGRMLAAIQRCPQMTISKRQLDFLKRVFPFPASNAEKHSKYIFISRDDAPLRKLANQAEIFGILKQRGFEKYTLKGMTLAQQARLFQNADVIVGPHGAAMTNLTFCQGNKKVLELMPRNHAQTHFYQISRHNDLDYYYLLGESLWGDPHADFYIDLSRFKRVLTLMGI